MGVCIIGNIECSRDMVFSTLGIIASQPYGVAKRATIIAVKVFNDTNKTTDA